MSIYTQIPSRKSTLLYRTLASVIKLRLGAPKHLLDLHTQCIKCKISCKYLSLSPTRNHLPQHINSCLQIFQHDLQVLVALNDQIPPRYVATLCYKSPTHLTLSLSLTLGSLFLSQKSQEQIISISKIFISFKLSSKDQARKMVLTCQLSIYLHMEVLKTLFSSLFSSLFGPKIYPSWVYFLDHLSNLFL